MDLDLVKAYLLFKRMNQYPNLIGSMRSIFMDVLTSRRISSRDDLQREAAGEFAKLGLPDTEENRKEFLDALIELTFATHVTASEAEDYINLARKNEKAQILCITVNQEQASSMEIYKALREFCDIPKGDVFISREEAEGIRVALITRFISSHLPFISTAKNHITLRDIDAVLQRSLWSRKMPGKLGGKAAGIVVAEKILLPTLENKDPLLEKYVKVPDTWYLHSGLFSEFLTRNNLHLFHTFKYKDRETIDQEFSGVELKFRNATFAPEVIQEFSEILSQIGEHPIIIRSSSFLEDSFGVAFCGKYESVFLTNQGGLEVRLKNFVSALKKVFASTYGPDPIVYRRDHGLLDYDERMSMVVQKVVGRRFGDYFFPLASGVMFSRNAYIWNPKIRREDGLVRLVFGLGTRAVDRVGSDYPRMIPLSHPHLRPEVTADQIKKYSQKQVDVLNLAKGVLETVDFRTLNSIIDDPDLYYAVSVEKDLHLAPPFLKSENLRGAEACLTFDNLRSKTDFVTLARVILTKVEQAFGRPVDIEFAWDADTFYLLQCRTLSVRREVEKVSIPPDLPEGRLLFTTNVGLSNSVIRDLEYIVYVNPKAYDQLDTLEKKMSIASVVNRVNNHLSERRYALMGPGRWGSNDVNLGVRVKYSDINKAKLLVEIAFSKRGYTPEVSFGTHFFQDLVEADIVVVPVFPDQPGSFLNEDFLVGSPNLLSAILPDMKICDDVVRVIRVSSATANQLLQVYVDTEHQKGVGFFGGKEEVHPSSDGEKFE
jgi:hypothetical protein